MVASSNRCWRVIVLASMVLPIACGGGHHNGGSSSGADGGSDAGALDAGQGKTTRLTFSCGANNIDAFLDQSPSMATACQASALDASGAPVPDARIQFLAEAGTVLPGMTAAGAPTVTYFPHRPGSAHALPATVATLPNEPRWMNNGSYHSPRQGLVTLVAYAPGMNQGTGMFAGEPFVDANDDGRYDSGEDFFDVNGDGK